MKKRVFRSIFLTSLLILLLTAAMLLAAVYAGLTREIWSRLRNEWERIAVLLETEKHSVLAYAGKSYSDRITFIAPDGTVLFDNQADAANMENHAECPEIISARQNGAGQSERRSETFGRKSFYYAQKLPDGCILRTGTTAASALGEVYPILPWILLLLLLIILIAAFLSDCLTRAFLEPVLRLNLQEPLQNQVYEELSPLLRRIAKQNGQIAAQIKELQRRQTELDHITERMEEGLLLLSASGDIVFANQAIRRLFPADKASGHYLRLCRDTEYIRVVDAALSGRNAHGQMTKNGRIYELTCGAAENGAAALFFLDITEREQAEQQRREFSANVSHELKTPLTSIMGYAEIIENGIVKPEDLSRFAGKIRLEAVRLLTLIEDIIRLSRLDEGGGHMKNMMEPVDLYAICERVKENLLDKAEQYQIRLTLEGTQAVVSGEPQTLEQMIFNLVDNAIVYNRPGGTVTITAGLRDGAPFVQVSDTGIGIAFSDQGRIFERFYRVDKSHSKSTGGTGLGLSIVKHDTRIHGAEISLQSAPGKGTHITLTFPARP